MGESVDAFADGGGGGPAAVDHCEMATVFVSTYLVFNVLYNITTVLILKYGSATLMYIAVRASPLHGFK